MQGQKKLTQHEAGLIRALCQLRIELDDEIERLRAQRAELTAKKIAERFEITPHMVAMISCGQRWSPTADETRVRNREWRRDRRKR